MIFRPIILCKLYLLQYKNSTHQYIVSLHAPSGWPFNQSALLKYIYLYIYSFLETSDWSIDKPYK